MELTKNFKDLQTPQLKMTIAESLFYRQNIIIKDIYDTDTKELENECYYVIPQDKIEITFNTNTENTDNYFEIEISYSCDFTKNNKTFLDCYTAKVVRKDFKEFENDIYFKVKDYEIKDYDSIDSIARRKFTEQFKNYTTDLSMDNYFRTIFTVNNKKYLIARDSNFHNIHLTAIDKGAEL